VATGDAGSVEVRTPSGAVHDVGTRFDVQVSDRRLRVRVREGVVELRRDREAAARAGEGMQIDVAPDGTTSQKTLEGDWSWTDRAAPPIRLEGLTLGDVAERVARERGLRVDWRGATEIRDIQLHGQTPLSPDEALAAATAACDVKTSVEDHRLVLRSNR
jgi:ferric-dicitrate binding protein FerR (iron transport regulator)